MLPTWFYAGMNRFNEGDVIKNYVITCLENQRAYFDACRAERDRLEGEGYRIVDGGQTGQGWEITDWRTGAILASGTGTADDHMAYFAASDRLNAEQPQYHIDKVGAGIPLTEPPVTTALPPSLAGVLFLWVTEHDLFDDQAPRDIAAFTGLPVDYVRLAIGDICSGR